jgi:hypothetical protein
MMGHFRSPKSSVMKLSYGENECGDEIPEDDPRDEEKGAKRLGSLYPPLRGWVALHWDSKRCAGSGQAT